MSKLFLLISLLLFISLVNSQLEIQTTTNNRAINLQDITDAIKTFLGLTDTPNSYAGQAGKCLKVNGGENAVEFASCISGETVEEDPLFVAENASLWLEAKNKFNATYHLWAYNQTTGTYNATYSTWAYNMTIPTHDIGEIWAFAGNVTKILTPCIVLADGENYSRTDYPTAYDYLGLIWGNNTSTDFKIVNMTDRVPVGSGGFFTYGIYGGEINHTLTTNETHTHTHTYYSTVSQVINQPTIGNPITLSKPPITASNTGAQGQNESHNNMPPYAAMPYVIRIC